MRITLTQFIVAFLACLIVAFFAILIAAMLIELTSSEPVVGAEVEAAGAGSPPPQAPAPPSVSVGDFILLGVVGLAIFGGVIVLEGRHEANTGRYR